MTLASGTAPLRPVPGSAMLLPGVMVGISLLALGLAELLPEGSRLFYFIPYTFLGNSLAPLPYDGAVVYLGSHHPVWLIVAIGTAATLLIEAWNMEVLRRILAREGTRTFRDHHITQTSLRWYRKAPFWSLVATCVLPIVPHYPMRFLAVLAHYPMWKYQLSVILGRGTRYSALAAFGLVVPIPGPWIVAASVVILAVGIRSAHRMNRPQAEAGRRAPGTAAEEA
ncbi:MAG TPA: hypothetical protein VFU40_06545 [Gemmatimonadales bacterium]|nr:hypothetical protein [Gemmatimonadales bacterium]